VSVNAVPEDWRIACAQSAEADVRVLERWLQDSLVVEDVLTGRCVASRRLAVLGGPHHSGPLVAR
jgi:hypothetical protein